MFDEIIKICLYPALIYNKSGKILKVNQKLLELFETREEKLVNHFIQEMELEQDDVNRNVYDLLLKQEEFTDKRFTVNFNNGNQKNLLVNKKNILIDGNVFHIISLTNISDLVSKINHLTESEKNHRILLEESTDPIFSFKQDGTYSYINNAFAGPFGKKPEEIIGKKIWDIFPKDEADKRFAVVKEVFTSKKQKEIEVRVPQPTRDSYYLTTVKPIFNDAGEVETVICISKNITERTYLEKDREKYISELGKANDKLEFIIRNRNKLFAIIAHDLRSPFNAILNLLSILKNDYTELDNEEKLEIIKTVYQTSKNTYNLAENLLTWANIQQDNIDFTFTDLSLAELVQSVLELFSENLNQKRLSIKFEKHTDSLVYADEYSILTVLRNLISNSIKFSPADSELELTLKKSEDKIEFSIKDQGIGIDENLKDKLLTDRNVQSSVGTEGEKGTGLGLLLCKEFIEKNNGEIWFDSIENKGTTFYFSLPKSASSR